MKRICAAVLIICLLLTSAGCTSSKQLTALQDQLDTLRAEKAAQQVTLDRYADILTALENEDYTDAIARISRQRSEKLLAEKGDIRDYLVTVELTADNFEQYFQWKQCLAIDGFGQPETSIGLYYLSSSAYEQGLILYTSNAQLEYDYTEPDRHGIADTCSSIRPLLENDMLLRHLVFYTENGLVNFDKCQLTTTAVSGTVTFVKAEYVDSYEVTGNPGMYQIGTITLINGEQLHRQLFLQDRF